MMHFMWKYRPRSFTAAVEKTVIQYMYSQSDTAVEMHTSRKGLKTGSHGTKKQSGFRHAHLIPVFMTPFLSSHPLTSVWCSWIINPQRSHLPTTELWFSYLFCSSSVAATHHRSVQQLVFTFTPHSVSLVWADFFWSHILALFVVPHRLV